MRSVTVIFPKVDGKKFPPSIERNIFNHSTNKLEGNMVEKAYVRWKGLGLKVHRNKHASVWYLSDLNQLDICSSSVISPPYYRENTAMDIDSIPLEN